MLRNRFFWLIVATLVIGGLFAGDIRRFLEKQTKGKRPNLIFISIDTLRADRLGIYGYSRDTSPELDKFARQGVIFENAFSVAPWTLPAHVSMFSGLYPTIHGVTQPKGVKISKNTPLLAEILKSNGYRTFAYTGGGYVSKTFGFNRGFEKYSRIKIPKQKGKSDFEQVFKKAGKVLETLSPEEPYFLFLHSFDVHCPYIPPEPYFSMYKSAGAKEIDPGHCGGDYYNDRNLNEAQALYLSDRYDGGIRWVDQYFGKFFEFLAKRGDLKNTAVIITSDHGEEFFEHGRIGHQQSLHAELLRIPLIIYAPGIEPKRVSAAVSNVDLLATVGELLNVPIEHAQNGNSLLPLMQGKPDRSKVGEYKFSELDRDISLRSIVNLRNHFIRDLNTEDRLLYDIEKDPLEKNNIAEKEHDLMNKHEDYLEQILKGMSKGEGEELGELPQESLESLKSLGYL